MSSKKSNPTYAELFDALTPEQQERVKKEQAEYATATKAVKAQKDDDSKNNIIHRVVEDDDNESDDADTFLNDVRDGDRFGDVDK